MHTYHDFFKCEIVIMLPLVRFKIDLYFKNEIWKGPSVWKNKTSTAKPVGKPTHRNKTLGLFPAIRFYKIEDGDKTEEGEESEMLIIHDSILAASKQNLLKRRFRYIDMFDHEGPTIIRAMRDLTVGVFKYHDIMSVMDVYLKIKYMGRIIRRPALNKYQQVLEEYKKSAKVLAEYQWSFNSSKLVSVR